MKTEAGLGYERVVFASELPKCDDCGEPFCELHGGHYFECVCVGPTQDGYDYEEIDGVLYAKKESEEPVCEREDTGWLVYILKNSEKRPDYKGSYD